MINPALRPIEEATYAHGPILLYSADPSPMSVQGRDYSLELGWVGNGETPGVHTARYGFFANFALGSGFRWTHFLSAPEMMLGPGGTEEGR